MGWSYLNKPGVRDLDTVRLLIGDTDDCDQLLQDEEIQFFIDQWGCPKTAAIESALALAARASRMVDESVGQVRVSFSQRAQKYYDLADRLRERQNIVSGRAIVGGVSKADKKVLESDQDRVEPSFRKDLHDNNRTYPSQEDFDEQD